VEKIVNSKRTIDKGFHAFLRVLWEQRVAGSNPVIPTISTLSQSGSFQLVMGLSF
jgi:hypothetical protein